MLAFEDAIDVKYMHQQLFLTDIEPAEGVKLNSVNRWIRNKGNTIVGEQFPRKVAFAGNSVSGSQRTDSIKGTIVDFIIISAPSSTKNRR